MTTIDTPARSTVARLERENQRLRAELTEVRRTSRNQVRDLKHAAALERAAVAAAAEAEIRHLRDELTAPPHRNPPPVTDDTDVVERAVAQLIDLHRESCITLQGAVLALVQLVEPDFGHIDETRTRPAEVDFGPGSLDHPIGRDVASPWDGDR